MERIIIGKWESVSLMVIMLSSQVYLNLPREVADSGGTAGWILIAYSTVLAVIIFALTMKIYDKFSTKDILEVSNIAFGRIGEIITGIIFVLYILFAVFVVLREFSENIKIITLTRSPISFVTLFFMSGIVIGAFYGIQAIARVAVLMLPLAAVGHFLILTASSQYFDVSRITPILGNGINAIFVNGIKRVSFFSSINTLFVFLPFLGHKKNIKKVGYKSIILSGFFMTTTTLAYLLVYQYPVATENFLPIYQLARLVNYGRFFQRIESIFVLIWAMTAFLYLSFTFYLVIYIFRKTFRLKYQKPLIPVFAIIIFTMSLLPENLVSAIYIEYNYFRYVGLFVMALILFISISASVSTKTGKRGKK